MHEEIKRYFGRFVFVFLLILIGVGFEALSPLPLKILIDNVLGKEPFDTNIFLGGLLTFFNSREAVGLFVVLIYCVSSIMTNVMDYSVSISIKRLGNDMMNGFGEKAFSNLEKLSLGYFQQQKIGDFIYRLGYDVDALGNLLQYGYVPFVTNILYVLSTIVIMFLINIPLALLALSMLPMMGLGLWIFNEKIGKATQKSENSNSALFSLIQQVLSQLKIVQAFNQEKNESDHFDEKQKTARWNEINMNGLGSMLDLVIGVLITIGYSVVMLAGIRAVNAGHLSTGLLVVFIFYLDNLAYPVIAVMNAFANMKEDHVKIARMEDFFNKKFQNHDRGTLKTFSDTSIVFDHVSVYGEENNPILENVSFTIPHNSKTVIVGVSGSGKTTLISLILRFLDAGRGTIFLGGKDIRKYSLQSLREIIAYVPQEIVLFNESIMKNITFGNPAISFRDVEHASRLGVAEKFIKRLPSGYSFNVGPEGINLSGGQRQRIMIARALLHKKARITIFDEPISFLDIKTRAVITENLYNFSEGKTMIVVSNILDLLQHANNVIFINEGKILHAGDKKGLLDKGNLSHLILNTL